MINIPYDHTNNKEKEKKYFRDIQFFNEWKFLDNEIPLIICHCTMGLVGDSSVNSHRK